MGLGYDDMRVFGCLAWECGLVTMDLGRDGLDGWIGLDAFLGWWWWRVMMGSPGGILGMVFPFEEYVPTVQVLGWLGRRKMRGRTPV